MDKIKTPIEEQESRINDERVIAQFNNAHNFHWLKSQREIEVYKMGLSDALSLIKATTK